MTGKQMIKMQFALNSAMRKAYGLISQSQIVPWTYTEGEREQNNVGERAERIEVEGKEGTGYKSEAEGGIREGVRLKSSFPPSTAFFCLV